MKRNHLFYYILFISLGCSPANYRHYWPYSNVTPHKLKTLYPLEYEDCMHLLDTILSKEAINNFKVTDSTIAAIEICNEIGGFFITNWRLNKYGETKGTTYNKSRLKLPQKPIDLPSRFIYDDIRHPEAMIRIIFNCYYKYLNGIPYNWKSEIDKLRTYWVDPETIYYYAATPDTIKKIETTLLVEYYFNLLERNDTVNILYGRSPRMSLKSSDWYYLTGVINFKKNETREINITLIDIQSELGKSYYIRNIDTISVGDTLTDYSSGWLKKGRYYFNYLRNTEYRNAFKSNR